MSHWSISTLDETKGAEITHLTRAYSLRPLANGMGEKLPIHPRSAGFLFDLR